MNAKAPSSVGSASLFVIGSMASLTIGSSIAKALFPVLHSGGTTLIRLAVSALILALVRRPWRHALTRAQWRGTILYGTILGLMNLLFYSAIARLPIGLAIGLEFCGPLAVAIFLSRGALDFLWAALAFTGLALILPFESAASTDLAGVGFALGAAACWAAYIIVGKRVGEIVPSANLTAYGMVVGAALVAPFGAPSALALRDHLDLIPAAIGVGLLSSAIPYTLEIVALKNLEPKTFGILLSLEPALGAVAAFLILGERMTAQQIIAIGCVMAASVGSAWTSRRVAIDAVVP